ncbi:hypothetical protein Bca101_037070 [Brassica carinata]
MHRPRPSLPRQDPHAEGREHATTVVSTVTWRGIVRRIDKPIEEAVIAVARKDTCRGIVHYNKEGMREGRNPNSREDQLQGHERTQSRVMMEPNQSRGLSRSEL